MTRRSTWDCLDVLVADDDPATRSGLEKALALLGHRCRVASDGQEAWDLHRAQHADVILSDWCMPRMDGVELCRRVRAADAEAAYTYFILMTSRDDKDHYIRGMEAGADDYHGKPIDLDELAARLVSAGRVVALHRRLAETLLLLRRDSRRSFQVARIDALTGVANRLRMSEDLDVIWSQARRYGHGYSAALVDIDWFKRYNDERGHLAGDDVLRRVAHAVRHSLRQGDGLYRYGGEEFLVILPEQTLSEAVHAMDRVREAVEALAIDTPAEGGVVTISVGIAELGPDDETQDAWLHRADAALYGAKAGGRDRVCTDPPGAAEEPERASA
jgi:diguanylate cyclase (GGDEF)-like protein